MHSVQVYFTSGLNLSLGKHKIHSVVFLLSYLSVRAKSRLCDTMYQTDVILVFEPKLNTEKNKLEMCKF